MGSSMRRVRLYSVNIVRINWACDGNVSFRDCLLKKRKVKKKKNANKKYQRKTFRRNFSEKKREENKQNLPHFVFGFRLNSIEISAIQNDIIIHRPKSFDKMLVRILFVWLPKLILWFSFLFLFLLFHCFTYRFFFFVSYSLQNYFQKRIFSICCAVHFFLIYSQSPKVFFILCFSDFISQK